MPDAEDRGRRNLLEAKKSLRNEVRARRDAQANRDELSRQIGARLSELPEYAAAGTVVFYVGFRSEVQTLAMLDAAWHVGKRVAVPYCVAGRLELVEIDGLDDLASGTLGILEPRPGLRSHPDRRVTPTEPDLIVVPGLAFDRQGNRLGYGQGYYDKLLPLVRPDAALVALAYECQLVDAAPHLEHDVPVHKVVTERTIYDCPAVRDGG
jgi:5-formyltetrahydrofolate cyclo-ligase